MSRVISEICIHHSYSPRDQELEKSIKSFNDNHYQRLYLPYKQPLSGVTGSEYVAYHWIIAGDGSAKQTRLDDRIGYHASNIAANERSIGICLTGNFDQEPPTTAQLKKLKEIVDMYKKKYNITEVSGHRKYANKSCPGNFLTDQMIQDLEDDFTPYPEWSIDLVRHVKRKGVKTDLQKNVSDMKLYELLAVIAKAELDEYAWNEL